MKNFKNSILAAAALVLGLTSCNNDQVATPEVETQSAITIRIAGAESRAVEAPATAASVSVTLDNAYVYVVNALGVITHHQELAVGTGTNQVQSAAGQRLGGEAHSSTSRVYVIGNVPGNTPAERTPITADGITIGTTNISVIQARFSALSTQTDYRGGALANASGQPVQVAPTATAGESRVTVAISPLAARLQLHTVRASGAEVATANPLVNHQITGFDVTGVFVDDYRPNFTYGGGWNGTLASIASTHPADSWATHMRDVTLPTSGAWRSNATITAGFHTARPSATDVWAYQVAPVTFSATATGDANSLPRLIIRLHNVQWNVITRDATDSSVTTIAMALPDNEPRYITVTGYETATGEPVRSISRGNIYRIGTTAGLTFGLNDITVTPNPTDVTLDVAVTIEDWKLADTYPTL
jgi:hypothetical protein